jgi:enoyl-CoA hydratase/carnithine racemase
MEQLESLLGEAEEGGARVVILTGGIDGFFLGHADLDDLIALRSGSPTSGDGSAWGRTLRILDRGPMVSIAAINGQAWGGGSELAFTCNLRWMSEEATLGFPEVALGLIPGVGAHRAIRLLPEHLAFELLVGGRPLSAAEAASLHLVNRVVPADGLLADAREFARLIVSRPPDAVAAIRELVVGHRDDSVRDVQRRQLELFMEVLGTEEAGRLLANARASYEAGRSSAEALGLAGGG